MVLVLNKHSIVGMRDVIHIRRISLFSISPVMVNTVRQFLLAADFGNPANPDFWENCIDFSGMRSGMHKNAADTQLFFIDACRERLIDALIQLNPHGKPLCSGEVFLTKSPPPRHTSQRRTDIKLTAKPMIFRSSRRR